MQWRLPYSENPMQDNSAHHLGDSNEETQIIIASTDFDPPGDPNAETQFDIALHVRDCQALHIGNGEEQACQCPFHLISDDDQRGKGGNGVEVMDEREEEDEDDELYPEFTEDMDTGHP